ncbi:MAG: hypothetical protein ACFFBD_06130 [Candidatus Hodarchaeota archaeon]
MSKSEVITLTENQLATLKFLSEHDRRFDSRKLAQELKITSTELKKLEENHLVSMELVKKNRKNLRYFSLSQRGLDCVTGKIGHNIVDISEIKTTERGGISSLSIGTLSDTGIRILEKIVESKRPMLASQLLYQVKLNNKWKRGQIQIPHDYQYLFDLEEKGLLEIQNKENYDKEGSLTVRVTKNGRRYVESL